MNEKVTIIVDDSVDIKQITNDNDVNKFFQSDPKKVSLTVDYENAPSSKNKNFPKGAIAGIVVGVVVVIVFVIVLIIVKRKAKNKNISEIEDSEDSGSLRI